MTFKEDFRGLRDWARRAGGGQVRCDHHGCGKWMDPRAMRGHLRVKHGISAPAKSPVKPETLKGGRPPKKRDKDRQPRGPVDHPRPEPKPPTVKIENPKPQKTTTSGGPMKATKPIENASTDPAGGIADGLVTLMNHWATRLPSNFKVAARDAEKMGEAFRGLADALRRRGQNMVEQLNVAPDCVDPYDEAARHVSAVADELMEVANRIQARYSKHIEVVNDPATPNLNFFDEDHEG